MTHGPQKAWLLSVPAPAQQDLWRVSPPAWPTQLSGPTLKSPQKPLENHNHSTTSGEKKKTHPEGKTGLDWAQGGASHPASHFPGLFMPALPAEIF